ncbi:S8 family peptidase [Leptolyngbya ohadii]|uniref:S8 family peptidase n=1 Tax=Leptolyngbya ohadii TaxID=1962290 RepID=UPI001CECBDB2|nr:S8 family peptidase [Leptolyngbya ohadii]
MVRSEDDSQRRSVNSITSQSSVGSPIKTPQFSSQGNRVNLAQPDLSLTVQDAPVEFLPANVGVLRQSPVPFNRGRSIASNSTPFDPLTGYGAVNAALAVAAAVGQPRFADVPDRNVPDVGVDRVNAPEAWQRGYTGQNVVVAVVDTGVDYTHADLNDNIWRNTREVANGRDDDGNGYIDDLTGWNFVRNNNNPIDRDGHGTHVAGTIAAENNGFGTTGVAFNAKIMPVKVLNDSGVGTAASVAAGIRYAAMNGADVINLSLGGGFSPAIDRAIQFATQRGAVVVMAAGNEGSSQPGFPAQAARRWGIAVGAIDSSSRLASFSNRAGSTPLDYVVAPGVSVYSTLPGNQYGFLSGTSMAAPHVAGVAALMLGVNRSLTPGQVESILTATANPLAPIA